MSSIFIVQSKNSAGPNSVTVQFVEYTDSTTIAAFPPGAVVQSFTLTLTQEESNAYEINSRWERTLTAVEEPSEGVTEAPAPATTTVANLSTP